MRWPIVSKNKPLSAGIFAGLLCMLTLGHIAPVAYAADTAIGVSICGQSLPATTISINEPVTDSVVNQSPVTVRGTISNTSQVEVDVDNQYSTTLAIGSNQTTFETDIALSQGTHTISVIANAICGGQDATNSIVLTYAPAVGEPTNGTTTPTQIDQHAVGETDPDTPSIPTNDIVQQIEQVPIIGGIVGSAYNFAAATGLSSTITKTNGVAGVTRVALTSVALTSVVLASSLAPAATTIVAQAAPGLAHTFSLSAPRSLLYMGWVIRGIGILAMAIAYFI